MDPGNARSRVGESPHQTTRAGTRPLLKGLYRLPECQIVHARMRRQIRIRPPPLPPTPPPGLLSKESRGHTPGRALCPYSQGFPRELPGPRDNSPGVALPVPDRGRSPDLPPSWRRPPGSKAPHRAPDRKSTRLNSSHLVISYAVFCLKKKKQQTQVLDPS